MILDNNRTRNAENGVSGFFVKYKKTLISLGAFLIALVLWGAIWAFTAYRIGVSFILPSPIAAFAEFFKLLPQKEFILAVTGSIARVLSGLTLGILSGVIAAFLSFFIAPLRFFFAPLIKVARATPVASFILICALWMNSNTTPIFIAVIMVFPIVYENGLTGLNETDSALVEVANIYRFSALKRLIYLYLPSSAPYFGSACISSLGLAWKSCVSAEVLIVTEKSVGYYVYTSKLYFESEKLFAWTIAIVLLSVLLEYTVKLIAYLIKRLMGRRFALYGK
ncbi:MAG: ABC transporter permease subunit [Clostridia bacterium]|nr:ABC transporter permease subunit [Clostridia bacterium]